MSVIPYIIFAAVFMAALTYFDRYDNKINSADYKKLTAKSSQADLIIAVVELNERLSRHDGRMNAIYSVIIATAFMKFSLQLLGN